MKIEITGRHVTVTDALNELIRERLSHTAALIKDFQGAHVILSAQKHRHIAEVIVRRRRGQWVGEAWSRDLRTAIHKAVGKVHTQLARTHDERVSRRRQTRAGEPSVNDRTTATAPRVPSNESVVVVEERIDRVKPMAVEEAVLMLDSAKRPFVMFRNSSDGGIALVYNRADGRIGFVAPRS